MNLFISISFYGASNNQLNIEKKFDDKQKYPVTGEHFTEAIAVKCSVKKMFLNILQNSQENVCPGASLRGMEWVSLK